MAGIFLPRLRCGPPHIIFLINLLSQDDHLSPQQPLRMLYFRAPVLGQDERVQGLLGTSEGEGVYYLYQ